VSPCLKGAGKGTGHIAQSPFLDKGSGFGDGKEDGKSAIHGDALQKKVS